MAEEFVLDVDFNITKAQAKAQKLQREFEISKQKAANIKDEMQKTADNIEKSKQKQAQLTAELEHSAQKLDGYLHNQIELSDKQVKQEVKKNAEIQKRIDQEEIYQLQQNKTLAKQEIALNQQNAQTATIGANIALSTKKTSRLKQAFENSGKSVDKFAKRVKGLAVRVFVFSMITKALRGLREQFGKMITEQGTKTAELANKLKSNLATLGRTFYESAKPYIEWLLEKFAMITQLLSEMMAKALGKDITQMQKLANSSEKVAENTERTEKATAGFDTLQKIDTSSAKTSSSKKTAPNQKNFDDDDLKKTKKTLKTILELVLAIGVGIAAWKLTTFLSDLGIVNDKFKALFGILITIAGTILFVKNYSDAWVNGIDWENFIGMMEGLVLIVGGLGFAFGKVGSGIGLIITGISLVILSIKDMVENGMNGKNMFTFAVGAISIAFGVLLIKTKSVSGALKALFSSKGWLAIGIAVLVTGIAYLAENWDKLSPTQRTITILGSLTTALIAAAVAIALFHTSWSVGVAAAAIAGGITLLAGTYLFKTANKKGISTDLKKTGSTPTSISRYSKYSNMSNPIPALATGAVLPGGSPMLAWVNDQPKGQGYIEGSVDNIAAAFEKYLDSNNVGNQNINITFKGSLSQLARVLSPEITRENKRASIFT